MGENLTTTRIKAALAAGRTQRWVLWDSLTGLGLRVSSNGSASWIFQYRPKGAKRGTPAATLTIGTWPTITIAMARKVAQVHAGAVALGKDPAAELREKRLETRRVLGHVLEEYQAHLTRRRIVRSEAILGVLKRGLSPWLAREVSVLSRQMIVGRIEALEAAGKPGAAVDLRRSVRTFLEFCVTRGLIASNVMAGLKRPKVSRADRLEDAERKGHALDDGQVRALWLAAADLGSFGGLLQLGILTGMRRNELASLTWADVGEDRLTLAALRTKTGQRHQVPITPLMRHVIQSQSRGTSPLLFPPKRRDAAMLTGWTALVASATRASDVPFTMHDLRRSCRTIMSRCGVAEEIAELAIGHSRVGLVKTYNRNEAWTKRIAAFEAVSMHISGVIAGENADVSVVRLRG